ncbi:putative myosin-binding protein 6 [Forsythia ovata]|uniref:Myosin-binding protein 6 n=1 Tax=Forsythia ovata TaxID=205694 RepID=A0ABD1PGB9_9LAMI
MPSGEIEGFVEKMLGKFANFMIYAVLEWVMIILLFIDGILSFISYELAKFFESRIPCLICTKINRILVRKNSNFCYNNSLCEVHKKDISALAYCHVHKKLSDLGGMCEGCLLSFATEKGSSDCGKYKSLVGILHKDIDCFVEDFDSKNHTTLLKNKDTGEQVDENGTVLSKCSCCGELLKTRTSSTYSRSLSMDAPTPSPRAPLLANRNEGVHNMELPHIKYKELKFNSDNEPEVQEDENVLNGAGREDIRAATVPLLPDSEDINEGLIRTPNSSRGYRFFGILLSDSAQASPRWDNRGTRKLPGDDASALNGADADSILHCLKRQVRLDRKSLMALYMELDEERSASAVAANNAMAMITRLQAEKAAVQMEALQYQRMMEEQANTIKKLYNEKSDCGSSSGANQNEHERSYDRSLEYVGGNQDDFLIDLEGERSHLLALLTDLEKKIYASLDEGSDSSEVDNVKYAARGGNEKKGTPTREVSLIRDRLRVIELDSGFLKHAVMTLQQGGEGTRLLTEIAQHLRQLRITDKIRSEEMNA